MNGCCRWPDLLILDEVGHQHGSDAERLTLFDVINARYEQCRPTLLITNLSLSGLREYLDDRPWRFCSEGGGRVLVFDWQSQRDKYLKIMGKSVYYPHRAPG